MHLVRIYQVQLKKSLATWLQYRVALLIWLFGNVVNPTIYLVVWATVAESQGGSVGGYDSADFAAYFIAITLIGHLTFTWTMWEYDRKVRTGEISAELLLPVHPIHSEIAHNIAYKLLALVVLIPALILLSAVFNADYTWQLSTLLPAIPAIIMAYFIRFMMGFIVAMSTFWTTRNAAINRAYFTIQFFLAGQFTPIEFLPDTLHMISSLSYFRWVLSFPVNLVLGKLTTPEIIQGLSIQFVWVIISYLLVRIIWQRATRKYAAFGS